jgi:hypothetical protein
MKNNKAFVIVLLMLILTLTMPVFAEDDEITNIPKESAVEEITSSPEGEPEKALEEEVAGTDEPEVENAADESREDAAKDESVSSGEEAAPVEKIETTKEGGITIVCKGKGKAELTGGKIVCTPDDEYEIISITADKKIGDVKAGQQLAEESLIAGDIEDGTTITIIFERCFEGEPLNRVPASASAIFCGPAE